MVTGYLLAQTIVTPIYGKLGDLYGRKIVLQSAIVLFLAGSILCGLSRSMMTLVAFRAIQGLGGGGLNVTTQAVVGDIVAPRDRGRYQGIFGAVFGLASIAGPLLGGYFTTHLSWRWIFYINVPLGIAALVVLAATLPGHLVRREHAIGYAGAGLLAVVLIVVTLVADMGGSYAWTSPLMLGLIAVAAIALVGFALVERRAREPVLPPHLFGDRTFALTSAVGLIVGFALFGSVTYFPLFLQVVKGVSPTASGLQMLPMMGGMLTTSIISGQLISRTGRYKLFPVAGTAIMTVGLYLLSRLSASSSTVTASLLMLILGVGLGMVMQVLVIAVQNAVAYKDLGVATSGATLFRLVGGSLGTAVLGAVFAARLASNVAQRIPGASLGKGAGGISIGGLAHLPPAIRADYGAAFTDALNMIFLVAAIVCALGFVLSLILPERPLRRTIAEAAADSGQQAGESFARPAGPGEAEAQLAAALARLGDRDVQERHIARMVERAGEHLTPVAAWLLVRIDREPKADPVGHGVPHRISAEQIHAALDELELRGLIDHPDAPVLTPAGCAVLNVLNAARREHLAELAADWDTARDAGAAAYLREAVANVVPPPRPTR